MTRVLVTRPVAQNSAWAKTLAHEGFEVGEVPMLSIEALPDSAVLRDRVLALDEYDKIIFVSQNAVEHAFKLIDQFWPQMPVGIEWFAIGNKTLEVLEHHLQLCAAKPQTCKAMNSENLLELPALIGVNEQKILICKGRGGRQELQTVLEFRGARVDNLELYERNLPDEAIEQLKQIQPSTRDLVALFSGESLENFQRCLLELGMEPQEWQNIPILVPGRRVAEIAQALGFKRVDFADNASEAAMLRALHTFVESING
jgi:uroporphyrinogen-III synthase